MSVDVNIFLGVIGVLLSVSTYFIGKQQTAKESGKTMGHITTTLEHLQDDIQEIKESSKQTTEIAKELAVLQRDVKTAFNRIDETNEKVKEIEKRI